MKCSCSAPVASEMIETVPEIFAAWWPFGAEPPAALAATRIAAIAAAATA